MSVSSTPNRLKALLAKVPSWLWLTLIATVLRFVNLGGENIWYDESFTAWLAKLDLPHMWSAIQGDVHPPLWYLVEWVNVRVFGDSTFALRLPSAVLSVLAVLLVWRLALACKFQPRTAFIAGLLAAVLPASVYYGQDARMYPLLAVCVLGAALMAIRGNWLLFAMFSAGAVYSQNLGLFYVAAIGIAVALVNGRSLKALVKPLLAGIGVFAAWLPWLPSLLHQAEQVKAGFWIQPLTAGGVLWPLADMTMGWRMPDALQIHIYGVAIGLTLIGVVASRKWLMTKAGAVILAVVIGAPALAALVSMFWRSVYLPRAMLPASLMLCLIWAYPLNHLSKPNRKVARAIVVPMLALALFYHYFPAQGGRFAVDSFSAPIVAGWQQGDVIYHVAIDSCILSAYYLPGLPYALFPASSDLNQSLTEETKAAMGFNQADLTTLAQEGYKRAWVVTIANPLTSKTQLDEIAHIKRD